MTERKLSEADLRHFTGSEEYFEHWSRWLHYTEGVRFVCDRAGAYWLVDAIASYRQHPLARQEPFQCWKLTRTTGTAAVLEMNDGNSERAIIRQQIEYTDFPLPEIEMYLVDGILMLTSEY